MNAVVDLLTRYLSADEVGQQALMSRHPSLFTCEMRVALAAARCQLDESMAQARAACEVVDEATAPLRALPEHDVSIALAADERRQMTDEACMVNRFATSLADLLGQLAVPRSLSSSSSSSSLVQAEGMTAEAKDVTRHALWHQDADLVLCILSFLSLDQVLTSAEDVCAAWRHWLFVPMISSLFWREGIRREFPQIWHALVGNSGDENGDAMTQSVSDTDWRSVAMLCVSSGEFV